MSDPASSPVTVLVVDDHPVVRQGLRSMLEAPDIEVVGEASTGSEAVALVRRLEPDVVLMDIRMPETDGLSAMAAMKRQSLTTSVIVLTAYGNLDYLVRAIILGAAAYFLKGVSREELLGAIRRVGAGESLLKPRQLQAVLERVTREDLEVAPGAVAKIGTLTPREREVVELIVQGLTNKEIADLLFLSPATVRTHVEHIIHKLGVSDRTQAAVWAVRVGVARL